LNVVQQSNRQQANNDQRIVVFQIANPGKNAAPAFIEQIRVIQFYNKKF